jgi:CubicO group peptidase (beta-lactamase class C family)
VSRSKDPLARVVLEQIAAGAMPGAQWWVGGPDGPASSGAVGLAAIEPSDEVVREDTPFDLASLTKPLVTSLLAILLEREGRLPLVSTLGSIFPELRPTPYGSVTLRDAACHGAGFPAWRALYLEGVTREDYVHAIASTLPEAARGTTLYSDLGYLLLGFAVERAGGAALDRLFEERVARPLGLSRCGFAGRSGRYRDAAATERGNAYERRLASAEEADTRFRRELIRGAVHDGNAWGLGGVAGHAGLFGTATDVARIALALLEPPRLGRPRGSFEAMLVPAGRQGDRTVGLMTAASTESVKGILAADAVGHFGFTGTSLWIEPAASRVYVLLTNRVHPEVPAEDFVATRRAFHAAAVSSSAS